ncbi:hypothetical protein B0H10DRAFT_2443971 [Mycena sp. CBHHK59/15]|nr:hypothetical protein B0H10DRAFT_2443971 [Mycena sp. CBHHK59/15]
MQGRKVKDSPPPLPPFGCPAGLARLAGLFHIGSTSSGTLYSASYCLSGLLRHFVFSHHLCACAGSRHPPAPFTAHCSPGTFHAMPCTPAPCSFGDTSPPSVPPYSALPSAIVPDPAALQRPLLPIAAEPHSTQALAHGIPLFWAPPACPARRRIEPFPPRIAAASRRPPVPAAAHCSQAPPHTASCPSPSAPFGVASAPSAPPHRAVPASRHRRFPPPSGAGCCPL